MDMYIIIPSIGLFILMFTIFSTNMAPLFNDGNSKYKGLFNIKNITLSTIFALALTLCIIYLQLNKCI